MLKNEYKIENPKTLTRDEKLKWLNELGAEGWILCAIRVLNSSGFSEYTFRRLIITK